MTARATKHQVLIVDDEPDIHAVSRLSLKGLQVNAQGIRLLSANSGKEALSILRENREVAVVLLDVVMETPSAGLDACSAIRGELNNPFVRILLRTGQPGVAPERETIDQYDIDGYLPKAELTSGRLYSSVRTAIKAYCELLALERHRHLLSLISDCAVAMHSFAPLPQLLRRVLDTAIQICPAPLALLNLSTFDVHGNPERHFLYATSTQNEGALAEAEGIRARIVRNSPSPGPFGHGYIVPLRLHKELGDGWLYIAEPAPDDLVRAALPLLTAHAANALYSTVTEDLLRAQKGPLFENLVV